MKSIFFHTGAEIEFLEEPKLSSSTSDILKENTIIRYLTHPILRLLNDCFSQHEKARFVFWFLHR